ncbi:hypothetical protein F5Y19DRAFT_444834 [Xylariaceae sp. FL1651]|nr:hypothetical protein F5Y19DRAFT_444834 [Xylariaceae sp. FL1651]
MSYSLLLSLTWFHQHSQALDNLRDIPNYEAQTCTKNPASDHTFVPGGHTFTTLHTPLPILFHLRFAAQSTRIQFP